jgi:hypothetical protein
MRIPFRYIIMLGCALYALFAYWDKQLADDFERCNANPKCLYGDKR